MLISRCQIESCQDRFNKGYSHFIRQTPLWRLPGAAALPLAALQSRRYLPRADEKVCLIICGANVDPASLN